MTWKFSRSHQNAYHICPRLCFLNYYADGTGYESSALNVEQSTGTLAHDALSSLLEIVKKEDRVPTSDEINKAMDEAIAKYRRDALERGFDIELSGGMKIELIRQSALVEGLVRTWIDFRLPELLTTYKVVAVEEEWEIELAPGIVVMVRMDFVLQDRMTGEYWAGEFKTSGIMDDKYLEKWRYDSQTLMHCWAIEKKMGERAAGVKMEILFKGNKGKDYKTGEPTFYSPFLRAYRFEQGFEAGEMSWDSSVSRRKGWNAINVWEGEDIREWYGMIPDEVKLGQIFGVEVFRDQGKQEIWLKQTIYEQQRLASTIEQITRNVEEDCFPNLLQNALTYMFPARLSSDCYQNKYRKQCKFLPVCWENVWPDETEIYRVREPHHLKEWED